ncbi:hypothetical protein Zmor_011248 [Zophobas morio]|uniref:Fatty acid synthase n=1 Tax=Zophobas morio TaxID=2755281 RepID=A0AA38IUS2_9CUCU|nr:hypothetical protein Zmor_011248 [Zophobas morio]
MSVISGSVVGLNLSRPINAESIGITGVAGRFPNCANVVELEEALFKGIDLVSNSHNRWSTEALKTSPRLGIIHDFPYFDAAFFGINPKEANTNDPRLRKILEVTYEALVDAGLNPTELRGKNVGIFLGVTQNDISDLSYRGGIIARSAAIMANVISFCFDFKGPSLAVNTACSSGFYALTDAVDNILAGRCDLAVVGAVQHQFDPAESVELIKIGVLHEEGICRSFDADRKGYVKSEGVAAIVLQKVEDAKRIYATFAGLGTNVEGFKRDGFAHPSHAMQEVMFRETFKNFNLDPLDVNYVETHCTGTRVGDVEEVIAIDDFYTKGRKSPLLIGSIKSNIGHTETTSGLVSIIKTILAIREGVIPGNLRFKSPDPLMRGIREGRLKVIDKNMPLPNGLIAIDSFGFGGANAMVILRPYSERKQITNNLSHRLVIVSGRTEEAVQVMLEAAVNHKTNAEFLSLIDSIHYKSIDNHNYRGYTVLSNESHYGINQVSSKKRPIWYVFAGFGSQWSGMGKDLMKFDVCRNTIKKCANALKPYGVDLEEIVVNGSDETLDNMVNTFTAITAVSIALTDLLTSLNIEPSGIIGHSLGEIACAYADGLITAEQAVLMSYGRSNATTTSNLTPGLMAAVGLSVAECSKLLPEGVYIACDNSDENVTVSGPEKSVTDFLHQLSVRGIFNRVISNSHYALHTPHLAPAGQKMYTFIKKVLPDVKSRSKRWLPSALPESEWNSELGKYNSAEYHFHNYLNRVHFRQLLTHIPKDAIVIEIAPRGLLQAILKRALDPNVALLSLLKPGVDNVDFLLSGIGKLYNSGGQPDLKHFYKPVSFPVSIDTPMISNLVKWDHRVKWHSLRFNPSGYYGCRQEIDMNDQNNHYLEGHMVDGRLILPAAGYIYLVWQAFARMMEIPLTKCSVVFENVKTLRPILLHTNETSALIVNIFKSTGNFEICLENDERNVLSSGRILVPEQIEKEFLDYPVVPRTNQYKIKINSDDFYNCMHLRGFDYSGIFMGVQQCDIDGRSATLKWNDNWVAFIDSMVQFILSVETTGHSLPTTFEKIVINPEQHLKSLDSNSELELNYNKYLKAARCGGIELRSVVATNVKRRIIDSPPTLRKYAFVSNTDTQKEADPYHHALDVASQIVVENCTEGSNISIAEVESDAGLQILKTIIERVNLKKTVFEQLRSLDDKISNKYDLLVMQEINKDNISDSTRRARFVFGKVQNLDVEDIEVVYQHVTKSGTYALIRRTQILPEKYTVVVASNTNYSWVRDLKLAVKKCQSTNSRIYLINEDFNSGIVGLFNTMRLEQYGHNVRLFLIRSYKETERFSFKSKFYLEQLKKDLTVNIYQDGSWGSYRLLRLPSFQPRLYSDACLLKDVKGVRWIQKSPYLTNKEISVHYASLCNWDLTMVGARVGVDSNEERLGLEYSGIDKNGNNVIGLVQGGAIGTSVLPHPKLTWSFPNKLSHEEAATIPVAYTLAHYALFIESHLSPKDSILVHNCRNDFSLAAIVLAAARGCTVYVVVEPSDRDYVKKVLPKIQNVNIITHSDNSPFYETLMKKTQGRGVNTILNSGSLDILKLSKKCTVKHGRFIEIGNTTIDFMLDDSISDTNSSIYNININDIFEEKDDILDIISADMNRYLKDGILIPLKYSVYDKNDVDIALKHLEEKYHSTKCLIKIKENGRFFSKPEIRVLAYPRTYMDPDKCYVIVGGLGGFGFEFARWLIQRGATKLILNSRREVRSGYHALWLQKWNNQGITVVANTFDTSTIDGAECLLNFANNLAPVGGIFNTALHIKDDAMVDQTPEDFALVASKIYSVQNTDMLSRKLCKKLEYFVMFSSIASSIGNEYQSNYAFANSAVERICETRKAEGLPSMAIEWGPLADVGILVRLKTNIQLLETQRQKLGSCLEAVDQFLQLNEPVFSSCVYGDPATEVNEVKSVTEAVANLFGIKDVEEIEDTKTLLELGMDSLLGFEIKHILNKEAGLDVTVNDIRNMTFETIKNLSKA